ncbi:unnamed protein product [Haemonchus placei]|uniref:TRANSKETOLASE_1 domain-containing protein n=1 Tax=Haemonchus placei TaxID=6290 RepID=A0A0N4X2U8_HAEPC|nr:unnamed protein product [Haemonchus placei]
MLFSCSERHYGIGTTGSGHCVLQMASAMIFNEARRDYPITILLDSGADKLHKGRDEKQIEAANDKFHIIHHNRNGRASKPSNRTK